MLQNAILVEVSMMNLELKYVCYNIRLHYDSKA